MTSYCPFTSSPGTSFGVKEKRVPQCRQNPSVMPARPSRDCPTSCPQFPQYRRFSGTCGSARIADDGSSAGTGGTSTSPAPSLPRDDRPLPGRVPRVPRLLPVPTDPETVPQPVPAVPALDGTLQAPDAAIPAPAL